MLSFLFQPHASHLTRHIQPDNTGFIGGQHSKGNGIDNKGL